jgi:hypothetical protein
MQTCVVKDLFNINISHNTHYDTVSPYDTLIIAPLLNYLPHQDFCGPKLHDTS